MIGSEYGMTADSDIPIQQSDIQIGQLHLLCFICLKKTDERERKSVCVHMQAHLRKQCVSRKRTKKNFDADVLAVS